MTIRYVDRANAYGGHATFDPDCSVHDHYLTYLELYYQDGFSDFLKEAYWIFSRTENQEEFDKLLESFTYLSDEEYTQLQTYIFVQIKESGDKFNFEFKDRSTKQD